MHRLLIAAASAAFLVASVAPAFADDYPACTSHDQDHCRVGEHAMGGRNRHPGDRHHHRYHGERHHHHHHADKT
jgi:hypothetical protein